MNYIVRLLLGYQANKIVGVSGNWKYGRLSGYRAIYIVGLSGSFNCRAIDIIGQFELSEIVGLSGNSHCRVIGQKRLSDNWHLGYGRLSGNLPICIVVLSASRSIADYQVARQLACSDSQQSAYLLIRQCAW